MSTRKNKGLLKALKKQTRKLRATRKKEKINSKIKTLKDEMKELSRQVKILENQINKKGVRKTRKLQLKDKQGVILRKIQKIKSKLKSTDYQKQFILASGNMETKEERKACVTTLKGEINDNTCYIETPFKSDCSPSERLIKNNPENVQLISNLQYQEQKNRSRNKIVYCPVHRVLENYGDDFEFVNLVRSTRIADDVKPKTINVLFRFSTPQTGSKYRFIYSSRIGETPKSKNEPVSTWRQSFTGAQFGQEAWRKNIQTRRIGEYNVRQKRYPSIKYKRQLGGPYAKFKEKDTKKWPKMPLWMDIQQEIIPLANQLFKKDKIINIPSADRTNDIKKDKKFLISDFKFVPITWSGYLEQYEESKKYFKNIPYNFVIIAIKKKLYVVVDVNLKGKLLTKKNTADEINKINERRRIKKEKDKELQYEIDNAQAAVNTAGDNKRKKAYAQKKLDAAIEKKRRFDQQNRINQNLSNINTGLTRSCDTHLEKIREIVRDMAGYDPSEPSEYNEYERAKNNRLKVKFYSDQRKNLV